MNINNVYTLNLLLPPNWRYVLNHSVLINNQSRTQRLVQPKAKAKAANMLIGIVKLPTSYIINQHTS